MYKGADPKVFLQREHPLSEHTLTGGACYKNGLLSHPLYT